jgi:uncharacterized protein YigE (DUF2233 family)
MLRQTVARISLMIFALLLVFSMPTRASCFRTLAPGIEYCDLNQNILIPWSHIHVFRIDLKKNRLDLVLANQLSLHNASVEALAHYSRALIAINGGFFDQNYQPLGLRISKQQQHSPLKQISWWGIFYINNKTPHLSSLSQYSHNKHMDFAIQSGPRLLINGRIPTLKPGYAERSALGITDDGRLIILVTNNAPMTTTALAHRMKLPPLNCHDALNLDGGSSSQLSAHMGLFQIHVHGFAHVSDAIVVKARPL